MVDLLEEEEKEEEKYKEMFLFLHLFLQPPADVGVIDPVADLPVAVDPAPAAMVMGPVVMSVPQGPPEHRAHYDLRHAFSGATSVESSSGETFTRMKQPKPAVVNPLVRPCPGKIRYFKI